MHALTLTPCPRRAVFAAAGRAAFLTACCAAVAAAATPAGLAGSGIDVVPRDAAFLSASPRLREQYDRLVGSNAFAAIRKLPVVARALASYEEQRTMPGSPLSMVDAFMGLPENQAAAALLADMVSTDTFVYGEPSCVQFVRLVRELQRATVAAPPDAGDEEDGRSAVEAIDVEVEALEAEVDALEAEAEAEAVAAEDDDGAEADEPGPLAIVDAEERLVPGQQGARQLLEALADNLDLIVVPDVVWGFKIADREAGAAQVRRLEALVKLVLVASPDLQPALARRRVAGAELLTFTLDAERLPWDDLVAEAAGAAGDAALAEKVANRLRELEIVVALGVVGDWVILSVGDSVAHLEKLALPGSGREGLVSTPPFAPLVDHADRKITGISFLGAEMAAALAAAPDDFDPMLAAVGGTPEAAAEVRTLAADVAEELGRRQPEPGPWMAFSFLGDEGYEGYAWDWSRNMPLDGSRRLDLLQHAGGTPLGVLVSRLKSDPEAIASVARLATQAWALVRSRLEVGAGDADRSAAFAEHVAPLGERCIEAFREKLLPALADGQVGLVLDAEARTTRPQRDLPASADPLPLVEPAIVLPLADRALFVEGLNDLFALADELVAGLRRVDPIAVPEDYEVPEPEKAKVAGGTVWSFALPGAGLDEQIRPAIGVGDGAVVLALVPAHAGRMLAPRPIETGAALASFAEPLAGAAALDVAGIVDALGPWLTYLTRCGCVQRREGFVDADEEISADDEDDQAREALAHVRVLLESLKSLRTAVAETSVRDDAVVTHWRNVIRDTPAKP